MIDKNNIEFNNDEPLYKQIRRILESDISTNKYQDKLPSEVELSKKFDVSVITVKQAINELVYKDILYRRPRRGTFINRKNQDHQIDAKDIGFGISSHISNGLFNPFYSEILQTIETELKKYSYHVIFVTLDKGFSIGDITRKGIKQNHFKAFFTFGYVHDDFIDFLLKSNTPAIIVDYHAVNGNPVNSIVIDNENGAYEIVKYIISLGHKKIGFLGGKLDLNSVSYLCTNERFIGYKRALQEFDIEYNEKLTKFVGLSFEHGYEMMKEFLEGDELPTAIFAVDDEVALGAMEAIKEAGLGIPEDISIAGFDDISASSKVIPPLTTVRVDKKEMGRFAVKKFLELIGERKKVLPDKVVLKTKLSIRQSCASPK